MIPKILLSRDTENLLEVVNERCYRSGPDTALKPGGIVNEQEKLMKHRARTSNPVAGITCYPRFLATRRIPIPIAPMDKTRGTGEVWMPTGSDVGAYVGGKKSTPFFAAWMSSAFSA